MIKFSAMVHADLDVEEPSGWLHIRAVLLVPEDRREEVRCQDLQATDEAGVVLNLPEDEVNALRWRIVRAFERRGRAVHEDRS